MTDTKTRQSIIDTCLLMEAKGVNRGTSGNISVRTGDGMLITPSALPYEKMTPQDIVHMGFDETTTGRRKPSSEWRFHLDILRARPDINAVLHAHPTYCTSLAIMNRNIPAIHYMIAAAGGPNIRCAPYATYGTPELSAHALKALENRQACLLAHHGAIFLGSSLDKALWLAVEVEALAQQYLTCLQIGDPPVLSDAEIEKVCQKFASYGYGHGDTAAG